MTDKKVKPKKKSKHFLNNKDMLREWKLSRDQDAMTDTFSSMIMTLTSRYSSKVRFNVCDTFRSDMESYALATVAKVWRSFDPEKSSNPFAYFTQVVKHGFYQYQNLERNQYDITNAVLVNEGGLLSHAYMVEYEFKDYDPVTAGGEVTISYGEGYDKEQHDAEVEAYANRLVYGRKPKPRDPKPEPIQSGVPAEEVLAKLDRS